MNLRFCEAILISKINTMDVVSLNDLIRDIERTKKDLDNAIESMDQGERTSERVGSKQGSVRGSNGNARLDDVSRKLDELIRSLLRADDAGAKRVSGAGVGNASNPLPGSNEGVPPGRVDDAGNEIEHGPQSVYEITLEGATGAGVLAHGKVDGQQRQDSLESPEETLNQLIGKCSTL